LVNYPGAPTASVPFDATVGRCLPVIGSDTVPDLSVNSVSWASGINIDFQNIVDGFTQSPACNFPLKVTIATTDPLPGGQVPIMK
jgi:hypothetical protein